MAEEDIASHYEVLEELGREYSQAIAVFCQFHRSALLTQLFQSGGSFGVVYKGIERATGETVAIKHVCHNPIVCDSR